VTLVLQGLTLPQLIRWLKVKEDGIEAEREEMEARLRAAEAAIARIEELTIQDDQLAEAQMVKWMQTQYQERIRRFSMCCQAMDDGSYEQLAAIQTLQHQALKAERKMVVRLRNQGTISDEILHRIERDLDLEEARLVG
jgi:NhaP-type Na+/H+ or K+/H+ antiporter